MRAEEAESFLKKQIPISEAHGIRVVELSESTAELSAPLDMNRNHLGTAFGGSLNSVLVFACYTWLYNWLDIHQVPSHVIVKSSEIKYLRPVKSDFTARCASPDHGVIEKFDVALRKKKHAKLILHGELVSQNTVCCHFHGEFVAINKSRYI